MKKVLVFGSFDLLHEGHKYFFNEAKKLGDKLYVVVARDSTIRSFKGHEPRFNERDRVRHVRKLGIANSVVLGQVKDKLRVIEKINPDIIALGYDQNSFSKRLRGKLLERGISPKVVRLKSYEPRKYKSSLLKKKVKN